MRFEFALGVFFDPAHVEFDATHAHDGELRRKAVCLIEGKLYVAVFHERDRDSRIISARRADTQKGPPL